MDPAEDFHFAHPQSGYASPKKGGLTGLHTDGLRYLYMSQFKYRGGGGWGGLTELQINGPTY